MFLGGLSTNTERKARKASNTSEKKKKEDLTSVDQECNNVAAKLPIVYSESNPDIPRDLMIRFFQKCTEIMLNEETVAQIVRRNALTGIGMERINVEVQTETMENMFQIEKTFGCKFMSDLPSLYPDDVVLLEAGKAFTYSTLKCFLSALKLRFKNSGCKLRTSGPVSRTTLLEFFEGCNATMVMAETKAILRAEFEATQKLPNQKIINLQHQVLELLGLDYKYGVSCLNRIQETFPDDHELAVKMNQFLIMAQIACREATMTPAQVDEFYANIPMFMHHFPHLHIYYQQRAAQQEAALQQRQQQQAMQSLQSYFTSSEGSLKVKELGARVETAKSAAEASIADWDAERRQQFFDAFKDHPALALLNSSGEGGVVDPKEKMLRFLELSDSDLQDLMKMQLVLAQDIHAGGTIVKELASTSVGRGVMGNMHALRSVTGLVGPLPAADGLAHSHASHEHVHGEHCSHGGKMQDLAPDVVTGKSDVIDR